jgi:DNA helicase-2/ATP-dependent DNA helicase PcrA
VRLEQNYRSTGNILKAANAVIEHNADRLGKELWTADSQGEPIRLYTAFNEIDEAQFVVERIRRWVEEGNARSEVAILYRSNAQSRVFEERLLNAGMPYRVYGGLRFFERAEIKDALAYLRLLANRDDDPSFDRIANVPTRGLGAKSLDAVRDHARAHNLSLWQAAGEIVERGLLPARAASALGGFLALIDGLDAATRELDLAEQVDHVLGHSGLLDHYRKDKGEKAEARVENLEELVSAARNFDVEPEDGLEGLPAFLAHAALEAGEGQAQNWEDCVQLMSLHSAKGLEFPLVFLTGLEEGLFPHQRSLEEPGRLEEERRLCYVGMTRAMRELYLSHAEVRRLHGRENYAVPSRFIGELPEGAVENVRPRPVITRPAWNDEFEVDEPAVDGMRLGSRVRHAKFGEGVVLNLEGRGEHARVQVNFEDAGSKWLVVAYANLQPV